MYKPCILLKISDLFIGDRLIFFKCVIRLGFEPKTHSLEGCCSIQLSYRTINLRRQIYGTFLDLPNIFPEILLFEVILQIAIHLIIDVIAGVTA